jgi:cell division protein FtsW
VVLAVVALGLLWLAGVRIRHLIGAAAACLLGALLLVRAEPYRTARILSYLNPFAHKLGTGFQAVQALYSLGVGGLFGTGLNTAVSPSQLLPEAHTDFIFAIIGEELGLVGTLCVTFLYGGLAYAGLRIARRVPDTFMRLAAAAATAWIVVQALVNIGAVIGVLPIDGVPLPLVSAGLSSLLVTMVSLGMLMSFAKREPGAAQALAAAGPGPVLRALSWLGLPGRRN